MVSSAARVVDDLGDPQAEVLVEDDDLAAGDQAAVDQQVGRAAGGAVQLEDGAGGEGEQVAHGHPGPAELDGDLHVDAVQHLDATRVGAVTGAAAAAIGAVVERLGHRARRDRRRSGAASSAAARAASDQDGGGDARRAAGRR